MLHKVVQFKGTKKHPYNTKYTLFSHDHPHLHRNLERPLESPMSSLSLRKHPAIVFRIQGFQDCLERVRTKEGRRIGQVGGNTLRTCTSNSPCPCHHSIKVRFLPSLTSFMHLARLARFPPSTRPINIFPMTAVSNVPVSKTHSWIKTAGPRLPPPNPRYLQSRTHPRLVTDPPVLYRPRP